MSKIIEGIQLSEKKKKPKPTSPEKWSRAKAKARSKFDVYPSAYANAYAAKEYKKMGGGWRMGESEEGVAEGSVNEQTTEGIVYATGPRSLGTNDVDLVFKNLRTNKIVASVVGNNDQGGIYEIRINQNGISKGPPNFVARGNPQNSSDEHVVYKLDPTSGKTGSTIRNGFDEENGTYYGMTMQFVGDDDYWSFLENMIGDIMWEDDAIEAGYVDRLNNGDLVFTKQQGVAEGSGKNVIKSVKVGNFRHDLVDTGMGWQVRIYNGDELYDTGMSKNSEQKGLAALEDAVAYTEKQTRTKRQGVAEGKVSGYKMYKNPDGTWYVENENEEVVLRNASQGEAEHMVWSSNEKLKKGVAEATGNPGMPHDFTAVQPGVEVWYKGRFAGWTTGKVYDDPYGKSGKMIAFEPNPSEFSGDEGRVLSLPYDEVSLRKSTSIGKLKGPEQGVAEGSEQVYRVLAVDKSNALSKQVKLKVKASSLDEVFERLAVSDWYPLEINGVEVVNGKRLKQGVAEGRFDEPLTGWHIVYRNSGNPVHATPSFESKEQAQKYLMTKMFANHQDYKVVHTAGVGVAEGYQDDSKEREENLRYSRSRNPVADAIRKKLNPNQKEQNKEQGVAEGKAEHAWNAGISDEDFIEKFGKSEFDRLTKKYGTSSIPVPDLVGYKAKEPTDPLIRSHRGLDGPGAQLKSIIKKQGMAEGHADQQKKIFKKNGQPVGEIGIDRESSPGVGQYYMKHYASGTDNSGYDSFDDALGDLRHIMKQSVYGELRKQGVQEGAPELLKQEMPLVRHIEKELEQYGYEKGTPEYNEMFKHSIAMYRKFGNIDAIKKAMKEGREHGSAYDRGAADSWYGRGYDPQRYSNPQDQAEYEAGYSENESQASMRKDYGDDTEIDNDDEFYEDTTMRFAAEKLPRQNPYGGLKDRQFRGAIAETEAVNRNDGDGWRWYEPREEQLDELKCWPGYTRVKGVPAGAVGSCKKKTKESAIMKGLKK